MYNTNNQTKFKASIIKPTLCDYSDSYDLVSGTITITGAGDDDAAKRADERDKEVMFKTFPPFTDCISEINNTQVDHAKGIDVVMPMYDLIEYSNNYSKISKILWQYYRNEQNATLTEPEWFKFKASIAGSTPDNGDTKNAKIAAPLKYLGNSWSSLEMPLINCEINLILTWYGK